MCLVIATGNALIVLEFFLDHVKLFLADDDLDLSHNNPIVCWHWLDTAIAASNRFERGDPSCRWSIVMTSCIYCTRIHRICQNVVDGAITPMEATARSSHSKLPQMLGQTTQRVSFLLIVCKHLRYG